MTKSLRSAEPPATRMSSLNPSSQYPFTLHLNLFHFQKRVHVPYYTVALRGRSSFYFP